MCFCCSRHKGRGELVLSSGCMCVIRSTLHHHYTLGGGVPFFSRCALCLWISPRPTPHWHADKSLISRLVLLLDIAGRSNDSSSFRSTEIWRSRSFVIFECKVISKSAADGWLKPVCVFLFLFLRSAYVGEGRGKRKKDGKRVRGRKKCSLCGWHLRILSEKNIIQTKRQEMKFSSQGYIQLESECPCVTTRNTHKTYCYYDVSCYISYVRAVYKWH